MGQQCWFLLRHLSRQLPLPVVPSWPFLCERTPLASLMGCQPCGFSPCPDDLINITNRKVLSGNVVHGVSTSLTP